MARVTEEALDDAQLRRIAPRRPPVVPSVRLAPVGSFLSLALLVGGAGAILAPDPLPGPFLVLAIAAVAGGGWLAHGANPPALAERAVVDRERGEVIRVALALGLRGHDAVVELARRGGDRPPSGEPGEARGDGGPLGRSPVLRAVRDAGSDAGESLDPGADEGL